MIRPFREQPKECIELRVPIPVATAIREQAVRERRSLSEVGTEILARGLRLDPARYGIDAESSHRELVPA